MSLPPRIGRYEVTAPLASGGMAEILLARLVGPSGFERPVVIKRILPHLAREPGFSDMFRDEARLVAAIRHPNVVFVHELGRDKDELFLVMEYLEGESVASLMRRATSSGRAIHPSLIAYIVAEACAGLHAAHDLETDGEKQRIVHRDVSPHNLVVTYSGQLKVIDFGIAVSENRLSRTSTGQIKGTFDYMAPEQVAAQTVDRRTDLFALGIVLYELLAGRRLFKRPTPAATVLALTQEPIVPPSRVADGVPRSLEAIAMRALERAPEDRYATAAEMRRELLTAMRELEGKESAHDHAEALAALMHACFADRIAERQELLRRMRSGSEVTHVPAGEVDDDDLPSVVGARPPERLSPTPTAPPKVRAGPARRRRLAVLAVLAVLSGGAALAFGRRAVLARSAEANAAPTAATRATTPAAASSSNIVTLHIETRPDGALAKVAGVERGTTPLELPVAYGTTPITLELRRAGFAPVVQTIVPDEDQRMFVALAPAPSPSGAGGVERVVVRNAGTGSGGRAPARIAPPVIAASAPPPQPTARFRKFE